MAAVHRDAEHKASAMSVSCSGESSGLAMDLVIDLEKTTVLRNSDRSVDMIAEDDRAANGMDLMLGLNSRNSRKTSACSRSVSQAMSRNGDTTVTSLTSEGTSIQLEEDGAGLNLFPTREKDAPDSHEIVDVNNVGVDLRSRVLVRAVENYRKSGGRIRGRPDLRMKLPGISLTSQSDLTGAERNPSEQLPQISDNGLYTSRSGKLPVDSIDIHSRSHRTRPSHTRQVMSGISTGVSDSALPKSSDSKKGHRFSASSSAPQFFPGSSNLELRCGSSSNAHVNNSGDQHSGEGIQSVRQEEKSSSPSDSRKSGETELDRAADCFVPIPSTHGASFSGRGEETTRSSRRAILRKQDDLGDDEDDSHPGTSLTLGLHPRLTSANPASFRASNLGEHHRSGKSPVPENNSLDSRRSKRKRDVGRMGLAVGSALADVEMLLPEVPNPHVSFPIKRTRLSHSPDSSNSDWEIVGHEGFRSSRQLRGGSRSGRAHARLNHQAIRRGPGLAASSSRPTVHADNVESIDLSDPTGERGAEEEIDQPQEMRLPTEAPLPSRPRIRSDNPTYRDYIDLEEPGQAGSPAESDRSSPSSVHSQWGRYRSPSYRRWLTSRAFREGRQLFAGLPPAVRRDSEAGSSRGITDDILLRSPDPPSSEFSLRRAQGVSHPISLSSSFDSFGDDDLRILESSESAGFRPSFRFPRRRADRSRHHLAANATASARGDTAEEDTLSLGDISRLNLFSSYMRDDIDLTNINADSENTEEVRKAIQVAEDERLARQLQASFALEAVNAVAPNDEYYARVLQAEEDTRARDLRLTREIREARGIPRGEPLGYSSTVQGYLGDLFGESQIFSRRFRGRSDSHPSLSRGRPIQQDWSRMVGGLLSAERRFEVMSAMEVAFRDHPALGLQLAGVDRDFDENDYEMLLALDSDIVRNEGASLEQISLLPLCTIEATEVCDQTCSICLEFPQVGDVVRRLPCIHIFHQACIDQWLQRQAVCPVCKAHI